MSEMKHLHSQDSTTLDLPDATEPGQVSAESSRSVGVDVLPHAQGHLEFLWHSHAYVNEYIRFADAKAAFIVTLASGALAAFWSVGVLDIRLASPSQWGLVASLGGLASALLILSICLAGWAVKGRTPTVTGSGISWVEIARGSADELASLIESSSDVDLSKRLAAHVFELSSVCQQKYQVVECALWAVFSGGFLGLLAILFR